MRANGRVGLFLSTALVSLGYEIGAVEKGRALWGDVKKGAAKVHAGRHVHIIVIAVIVVSRSVILRGGGARWLWGGAGRDDGSISSSANQSAEVQVIEVEVFEVEVFEVEVTKVKITKVDVAEVCKTEQDKWVNWSSSC